MGEEVKCKGVKCLESGKIWLPNKSCDCEKCAGELAFRRGISRGHKEGVIKSLEVLAAVTVGLTCLRASFEMIKLGVSRVNDTISEAMNYYQEM